jgi:hypothetical protein
MDSGRVGKDFGMGTQKNLDDIRFAVTRLYQQLTVNRCASAMGCDEKTAYTYQNDQAIPLRRLLSLLAFSRDSGDPVCADHNLKLVNVAAGLKVIAPELIHHVQQSAEALGNGGRLKSMGRGCPHCGEPLQIRGITTRSWSTAAKTATASHG